MTRDWESEFADVGEEFYPGSNKRIPAAPTPPDRVSVIVDAWDMKPWIYNVNGVAVEFFTVGHLAKALGRQSVTVRKWEREGVIPKAQYAAPSNDPRGKRRLYTREQVEGIVQIAAEEGVLEAHAKPLKQTRFTERVIELFSSLKGPGQ